MTWWPRRYTDFAGREAKPNTPSGRRAAARAVKKYEGTDVKTRPIFYDPKPFI